MKLIYDGPEPVMEMFGSELVRGVAADLHPKTEPWQVEWLLRHGCRKADESEAQAARPKQVANPVNRLVDESAPVQVKTEPPPGVAASAETDEPEIISDPTPFMRPRNPKRRRE